MSEDEAAAAVEAAADDPAARTRQWLLSTSSGALGTLSCEVGIEGFPFGSVVPFQLTAEGAPYVLIADIAAHTRNLRKDPRASLLVQEQDAAGDPQSRWRVTLIGTMQRLVAPGAPDRRDGDVEVAPGALAELHARYRARVPAADEYKTTHGFGYWRLDVKRVRYIAGFGKICWVDPQAVRMDPVLDGAAGAVAHMNEDHEEAMKDMVRGATGARPAGARMARMERTGFLVETTVPDGLVWLPFGKEIEPAAIRHEVVRLTKASRP